MSTFLMFDEGANELENNGLPSTVYFLLSTRSVAGGTHLASHTLAGGVGEITGTGYTRKSEAEPSASSRQVAFAQKQWLTGAATDWSNAVKSVVAATTSDNTGKALAAWDLSATRDMSQANTTLNVTPTLGPLS